MPTFRGTIDYNPSPPNQTEARLIEQNGFQSLLVRDNSNPAATANHLFYGKHKGNGDALEVVGNRGDWNGEAAIIFTSSK